jgi:hypothetical protein
MRLTKYAEQFDLSEEQKKKLIYIEDSLKKENKANVDDDYLIKIIAKWLERENKVEQILDDLDKLNDDDFYDVIQVVELLISQKIR